MDSATRTAIAHPIQGLVKYHGLRDFERRIPFHASISACTAPTHTTTTVAVVDGGTDQAAFDGEPATGRAMERIVQVVDAIRDGAGDTRPFHMVSRNSFPSRVGLGSSASGFAALAVAAAAAYGLDASQQELSAFARLGAGSASRAVTGYISEWDPPGPGVDPAGPEAAAASVSHMLPGADRIDLRIVVPLVLSDEPTEGVHREVLTSPLFSARLDYIGGQLDAMRRAVADGDIATIGRIAERDTLNLHAITMTSEPPRLTWRPETVAVMREVRRLRDEEDLGCWFSIDTGATPYVNTTPEAEERVRAAMAQIPGIDEVLRLTLGGPARLSDAHLSLDTSEPA